MITRGTLAGSIIVVSCIILYAIAVAILWVGSL